MSGQTIAAWLLGIFVLAPIAICAVGGLVLTVFLMVNGIMAT